MDVAWLLLIPIVLLLTTIAVLAKVLSRPRTRGPGSQKMSYNSGLHGIKGRSPLKGDMQAMFMLLSETLPDHIILSKVAFTALMTTDNAETRATLISKTADFVVCSREFKVETVVFLDQDAQDKASKGRNARIDAIMRRAGHRVLRYTEIPKRAKLAVDIKRPSGRRISTKKRELPSTFVERQAVFGERRRNADRRSGVTYFDDNFIERRDNSDRRRRHANVTHMGGFVERQRTA